MLGWKKNVIIPTKKTHSQFHPKNFGYQPKNIFSIPAQDCSDFDWNKHCKATGSSEGLIGCFLGSFEVPTGWPKKKYTSFLDFKESLGVNKTAHKTNL